MEFTRYLSRAIVQNLWAIFCPNGFYITPSTKDFCNLLIYTVVDGIVGPYILLLPVSILCHKISHSLQQKAPCIA